MTKRNDEKANPFEKQTSQGPFLLLKHDKSGEKVEDHKQVACSPDEALEHNRQGFSVYFCPNMVKNAHEALSKKILKSIEYLFIDIDFKHGVYSSQEQAIKRVNKSPVPPTVTVSSGYGVHFYWKIDTKITVDTFSDMQKYLRDYFQADQINNLWMRFPDSFNVKLGETVEEKWRRKVPCEIISYHPERRYKLSDFYFLEAEGVTKNGRGRPHKPIVIKGVKISDDLPSALQTLRHFDPAIDQLLSNVFQPKKWTHSNRSKRDYLLARKLAQAGFSLADIGACINCCAKAKSLHGDKRRKYVAQHQKTVMAENKNGIIHSHFNHITSTQKEKKTGVIVIIITDVVGGCGFWRFCCWTSVRRFLNICF